MVSLFEVRRSVVMVAVALVLALVGNTARADAVDDCTISDAARVVSGCSQLIALSAQ